MSAAARAPADATLEVSPAAGSALASAGERLREALDQAVTSGFPAGATVSVVGREGELLRITSGWACVVGERVAVTRETLYDLASLTKVVVTVPLVLALVQQGRWALDDPLARWLPGFPNGEITLRSLLTHSSGLPAHRELYRLAGGAPAIRQAVYREAESARPRGEVCYSDLGFMLLGWALEERCGRPLDQLFSELIAAPLELARAHFRPSPDERRLTAATELDGDQRLAPGLVWGEVHDGNAWALGGVAGHAGLFASVDDLVRFARALLAPASHPVLSAATLAEMTRVQAGAPPDVRGLGWRLDASDWGPWPAGSYWHTGFTGTSLLIAPGAGLAVVALLGGVHPRRRPELLPELRRLVHRELAEALR